jgi:hypothetical protein
VTDKIDELVSIIIAESTLEEIRLIKDGLDQYLDVFDNVDINKLYESTTAMLEKGGQQ